MNWIELVGNRIWTNLRRALPEEKARAVYAEEMSKVILDTELGRGFGEAPREGDPDWTPDMAVKVVEDDLPEPGKEDPLTIKGEKLSVLRARARAEWEPWRADR